MEAGDKTLGDIGEKRVIEEIISKYIAKPFFDEHLGFPNDARDLLPMAPRILFSIDGYSLSRAKLPWRSYSDLGYSAIVGAVSDHLVKGGFPRDIMVSIGFPPDTSIDVFKEFFEGIGEALNEYGLRLLGGDLNVSNDPWIDVAVLSYTSAKKPPGRCCGFVGDKVIVTGLYGAMGYVVLHGFEEASRVEWVVENTRRPHIYPGLAVVVSMNYRVIHASMDVSDGLGYTLLELARLMNHGIELHGFPKYYRGVEELCRDDLCMLKYLLNGGEEYGAVLFVDKNMYEYVLDYLYKLEIPATVVGEVVDKSPHIYYRGETIDDLVIEWDQFRGWISS